MKWMDSHTCIENPYIHIAFIRWSRTSQIIRGRFHCFFQGAGGYVTTSFSTQINIVSLSSSKRLLSTGRGLSICRPNKSPRIFRLSQQIGATRGIEGIPIIHLQIHLRPVLQSLNSQGLDPPWGFWGVAPNLKDLMVCNTHPPNILANNLNFRLDPNCLSTKSPTTKATNLLLLASSPPPHMLGEQGSLTHEAPPPPNNSARHH